MGLHWTENYIPSKLAARSDRRRIIRFHPTYRTMNDWTLLRIDTRPEAVVKCGPENNKTSWSFKDVKNATGLCKLILSFVVFTTEAGFALKTSTHSTEKGPHLTNRLSLLAI